MLFEQMSSAGLRQIEQDSDDDTRELDNFKYVQLIICKYNSQTNEHSMFSDKLKLGKYKYIANTNIQHLIIER